MRASLLVAVACVGTLSCEHVVAHDCPPPGVVGPSDGSFVTVCVIDAETGAPIPNATVTITRDGRSGDSVTVNTDGKAVLRLGGPANTATLRAFAGSYTGVGYAGFDASAMTFALRPYATGQNVDLEVRGLASLGAPLTRPIEVYVDPVQPAAIDELVTTASSHFSGTVGSEYATCMVMPPSDTCSGSILARLGTRSFVATAVSVDDHGTPFDPSDDVRRAIGFGIVRGVTSLGAPLTFAVHAAPTPPLTVSMTPRTTSADVVGVPGLAAPTEGVAFLPHILHATSGTLAVPYGDAALGDGAFWVMGTSFDTSLAGSIVIRRGVHDASAPVQIDGWLDPPTRTAGSPGATLYLGMGGASDLVYAASASAIDSSSSQIVATDTPASATSFVVADVDTSTTRLAFAYVP